jgi:hypothetical protein
MVPPPKKKFPPSTSLSPTPLGKTNKPTTTKKKRKRERIHSILSLDLGDSQCILAD